tara:strand:- start:58 stop:918 length:861 start_codon:yes stop_codon:yes gene_type:complete
MSKHERLTSEPWTVSYSEDVKGWPSFYSFLPDYMMGMNGFFYSWNGGNLYRHNTNTLRNNYYGVQFTSTINSVFNMEPMTIKLFKTMSYESDDRWDCTSLFSDLNTGSMLSTFFEEKEGEWFTYLREDEGTIEWRNRSANGIGACTLLAGPANAVVIEFPINIGTMISVGDAMYWAPPSVPPAISGAPTFGGRVTDIFREATTTVAGVVTPASITVDSVGPVPAGAPPLPFPGVIPAVGDYITTIKNAVSESHGARGYFLNFSLENTNTTAIELFAVGTNMMKSYP